MLYIFGATLKQGERPPGLITQAIYVLKRFDTAWLSARVDGLLVNGVCTLMGLELIEPSLFLGLASATADQFAVVCNQYGSG